MGERQEAVRRDGFQDRAVPGCSHGVGGRSGLAVEDGLQGKL